VSFFQKLSSCEAHLYISRVDHLLSESRDLSILDNFELSKYHRYRVDFKKKEFLASRFFLKKIIGSYLYLPPQEVHLFEDNYGKLHLIPELQILKEVPFQFNLSHSGESIAAAFCLESEIGVDVEYNKPEIDVEGIANRFFSPREKDFILSLTEENQKRKAFYQIWTLKEAYIKALGKGLSISLSTFDVPIENLENGFPGWFFFSLMEEDYTYALAVKNEGRIKIKVIVQSFKTQPLRLSLN
jgi:4'-phosphopantetheinyl transferase